MAVVGRWLLTAGATAALASSVIDLFISTAFDEAPNAKARPVARTRCISMGMSEPCGMVRTAVMNRPTRMMTT